MGITWSNLWGKAEPPPPMVLVPPLFDYPPIAARTRMSVPSYELMFGKLSMRNLFEEYFDQAGNLTSRIMLKPLEDPHVDLTANVSSAADKNSGTEVKGDALFRWQKDLDDPHTFMEFRVSTSEPMLQLRSCAYYPKYGVGAFGTLPLLMGNRLSSEDYGVMGVRYGSENLSFGASFVPFPVSGEVPHGAWLVGRKGSLTAGAQYKPLSGNKHLMPYTDLKNWNYAISYSVGSTSPLSPSFICSLELARSTQLIASFYQHLVVQRRVNNPLEDDQIVGITNYIDLGLELATSIDKDKPTMSANNSLFQLAASWQANKNVNNPLEDDQIVGITNYIDLGLELATSIDKDKPTMSANNSLFQLAASWQANKNVLLKGKVGSSKSSIALAFKSWWKPSFTFSVTADNDHSKGTTSYGFGIRLEDLRQPSYQRADPNYVMLTPSKEHLAPGVLREFGKRPMFQAEVDSGNYSHLPRELKPIGKIL